MHTKKTSDIVHPSIGRRWFDFLLENLLGGQFAMSSEILEKMAEDESIGMVFPDDPHVVGWTANRERAEAVGLELGIDKLPQHFNFPVGTMFWARKNALKPLLQFGLNWFDYPDEPLDYDGTLLHNLERLLPFVVEKAGYRCLMTSVKGISR